MIFVTFLMAQSGRRLIRWIWFHIHQTKKKVVLAHVTKVFCYLCPEMMNSERFFYDVLMIKIKELWLTSRDDMFS